MTAILTDILSYSFMRRALLAGLLLGLVVPVVGVIVVLKRLSMIGDTLSHASLAGVASGLIAGFNPVLGATGACVVAAFAVEGIRRHFPDRAELALAVVMSAGIGLAGVLSGFVPNAASFNSFLFGSIVTVSDAELRGVVGVSAAVLALCVALRRQLFLVTLDERAARLAGVRPGLVDALFVLMCALAVSVAARTVGALMVAGMMVVPVACALQLARSWRQTIVISCAVGVASVLLGLVISFEVGLKPGGTIVLLAVAVLVLIVLVKGAARLARHLARMR